MRIGIMGGTLDPVHSGHVQIAEAVLQNLALDRVMLLPAGDPPHKMHPTLKIERLQMARLAAAGRPGLFACNIEVFRGGTTYTVDTLRELRAVNPHTEWFYIIGADTLDVLDSWRSFGEVAKLCRFVVVGRGAEDASKLRAEALKREYGARIILLPINGPEISSTEIRERIAEGLPVEGMLPARVERFIRERGLYLCNMSRGEILEELKRTLKPQRMRHTLGVAETAVHLAGRYGVEPARAQLSALLHDCAKYMPTEEMQRLVRENVPDTDEAELSTPSVLHAPAGSVLARERFGVRDPAILQAIRRHTLGDAQMSPLDALIYVADFIEPGRRPFPGLEEARALAETDLFAAMRKCAELTNEYVVSGGGKPHPRSICLIEQEEEKHD